MPIPSTIADLSTTAASNSPAGSDPPTEGDNYLRAISAILKRLHDDIGTAGTAAVGAGMLGYSTAATYATASAGWHLESQITTTKRTLRAKARERVSCLDFGAVFDGTTEDSTAINAAQDWLESVGGGELIVPRGATKAVNIELRPGVDFIGPAIRGACIIEAASANTPIFKMKSGATTIEGVRVGGFLVRAHASGSTGPCFNLTGSRSSEYFHIEYRANANGTGTFTYLFDLSADPSLCYANHFDRIYVSNQKAPTKIWRMHNNGAGAAFNPNVGSINRCWIVDNTNITTIIDGVRSVGWSVTNSIFENNTGATVVSPGQAWTIGPGNFFELNSKNIVYENPEAGSRGENGIVIGNYFTTADTVDCTSGRGNVWINNTEAGAQTFSNNGDGLNLKLKQQDALVTAPTIAYQSGDTGTLTLVSNSRVGVHAFDGSSYQLQYTWNADTASSQTELALSVPSGYAIELLSASMIRGASGEPGKVCALQTGRIWIQNQYDDNHTLVVFVRYRRTIS